MNGKSKGSLTKLIKALPPNSEIGKLLASVENPSHSGPSLDRHVAIVGAAAVEHGLRVAITRHLNPDTTTKEFAELFDGGGGAPLATFSSRIAIAKALGVLSEAKITEVDAIRRIRNVFAHRLEAITFEHESIKAEIDTFWEYEVTNFDAYFAPIFPIRTQYAITCAAYFEELLAHQPFWQQPPE